MPENKSIVINTGPLIALVAACGDLEILRLLYDKVLVPAEVAQEIRAGGVNGFAVLQFNAATSWLRLFPNELEISPFLYNTLDRGEASVIQLAMNENIDTVCIDETIGRRAARLNGLQLTGSIGILLRAKKEKRILSVASAIKLMQDRGIWLSEKVSKIALKESGEL
jgi:predicted nucleic acid-binding protein